MFPLGLAVRDPPQGTLPANSNVPNPNLDRRDDSTLCPLLDVPTFTHAVQQGVDVVNAPVSHQSIGGAHQDAGGIQSIDVNINASSGLTGAVVTVPQQPENDTLNLVNGYMTELPLTTQELNPEAATFQARDPNLIHRGRLYPDLDNDWAQIQKVSAGGVGELGDSDQSVWQGQVTGTRSRTLQASQRESVLPFALVEDLSDILGTAPKQVHKVNSLLDMTVKMPSGSFSDKVLPQPSHTLKINEIFTADYYVALHNVTAAPGIRADGSVYPAYTPNHLGARVRMPHVKLRLDRWRYHLLGYEDVELVQFLEFGFPLGLSSSPDLECSTRNHGSAYMWYDHVDKFVCNEIQEGGMTGPFLKAPWWNAVISPLMTAHKKVMSRRTVFDATFGERSLNNNTPSDHYMGLPCKYTFPKIQDYKEMILSCGPGCFMWKRDLSRFFLQLPLDPTEYHRVGVIWRGLFFFFLGLAFGLRYSGLQGQKVTDAVSWILRSLGLEEDDYRPYNVCNYSDDLGGVEKTMDRAMASYQKLSWLLADLGLDESVKKAEPPTTCITYLGVQFDSVMMTMSVPPEKVTEIKAEIGLWVRKTTITRRDLQSLLGKLFWIGKVVMHARPFMGRLLAQLRTMTNLKDGKKVKLNEESRKDILWWQRYLDTFNGISMIVNEEPIPLTLEQLLDDPHQVCAGDATPSGGGAWHGQEYWCRELPAGLKDPSIPIHIKEFWIMIVSAKQWGDTWTGRTIVLFCDNDSVCDTIVYKKPQDPSLLSLLREFLYVVVSKKFFPVVRKIGTKDNEMADHISRRFDEPAAARVFAKYGLLDMVLIKPKEKFFQLTAAW